MALKWLVDRRVPIGLRASAPIVLACATVGLDPQSPLRLVASVLVMTASTPRLRAALVALCLASGLLIWPAPALLAYLLWRYWPPREGPATPSRVTLTQLPLLLALGALAAYVAVEVSSPTWAANPILVPAHYLNPALLVLAVPIVALVNSTGEELLWRKALWNPSAGVHKGMLVATQALSFGLAHSQGIPSGITGMVLAGVFSVCLAVIRIRLGFLAAVVCHFIADIAIFIVFINVALIPEGGWVP